MQAKARAIRLTPLAEADLEDIWTYTFEHLAQGDWVGRPRRARDEYRRYLVGSHVVFYRETTTTLDVIRVLHQRMDVDRHL